MTDRKRSSGKFKSRKKGKQGPVSPFNLKWLTSPQPVWGVRTGYSVGDISSDAKGVISQVIPVSMVGNMSEYTAFSAVRTQIRMTKSCLELTPVNPAQVSGKWESKINLGWNPLFNFTTFSNPTSITDVINLDMATALPTSKLTLTKIPGVPKNKISSSIANANPLSNTGDCGAWVLYGSGLTASTVYFSAFAYGWYLIQSPH